LKSPKRWGFPLVFSDGSLKGQSDGTPSSISSDPGSRRLFFTLRSVQTSGDSLKNFAYFRKKSDDVSCPISEGQWSASGPEHKAIKKQLFLQKVKFVRKVV